MRYHFTHTIMTKIRMTKKTKYWQKVNQMGVLYIAKMSIKW